MGKSLPISSDRCRSGLLLHRRAKGISGKVSNSRMRRAAAIALLLLSARASAADPALPATARASGAACTFSTHHARDYLIPLRLEARALPFAWLLPPATMDATLPV